MPEEARPVRADRTVLTRSPLMTPPNPEVTPQPPEPDSSGTRLVRRSAPLPRPDDTPLPTRTVGRFRVERELGRGGMGVVLLAADPTLNRSVALKLLREDDPDALARFKLEAAALAGLAHPHAVRVYETGEHAGRPYLAMEYVPGSPLSVVLREDALDPRRAARLIAAVAGAVQAAHNAGLVHRDVKPANILLDPGDQPKLTDFGVARRTDGPSGLTATDAAVGTPGYMAPEQAAGKPADARSDVYGLGATLYECLTGRPPFVGPPAAVFHQLATDDPLPPARLNPAVPRDLDTICRKCLEKDPARRYPSAAALADDLDRFLDGRPITARPLGAVGRTLRWCRRHQAITALTAATAVSLIGGSAAAGVLAVQAVAAREAEAAQRVRAEGQAADAEAARRRAEDKAAEAEAINEFLRFDVLQQAAADAQVSARQPPDPNLTVRAALDRAAARVGERFADRPAVAEQVRATLGHAYFGVGAFEAAAEQQQLALDSRRARLGPDDPDTLWLAVKLAWSYRDTARPAAAVPLIEDAVTRCRAVFGPAHPKTLGALGCQASVYKTVGRPADALALHQECLRLRREHLGPEHPDTRASMHNLAEQLRLAGRPQDARQLAEECVWLVRRDDRADADRVLNALGTLAMVYADVGRPDEALELCREVLDGRRTGFGPAHPQTLSAVNTLGMAYHAAGRGAACVAALEESLRLHRAHLPPAHPRRVTATANLAWAYKQYDRPADAVPLLLECLPIRKQQWGAGHPEVLRTTANLSAVYAKLGRWADALPVLEDECRVRAGKTPVDPKLGLARADLGECLLRLGRPADAEPHLLAGYEYHVTAKTSAADRNPVRALLGELYRATGRPDEAARWRELAPGPRPAGR